jgi:uncharacterized protein YkwD
MFTANRCKVGAAPSPTDTPEASPVPALLRSSSVLSALVTVVVASPAANAADQSWAGVRSRQAFVSDTNHARVHHDPREHRATSRLTEVAQNWAQWMARHHTMEHNPNLESQVHNWQSIGENVGSGGSEPPIHRAFMNDTYHRDNILSPDYTQVGIGTARDDNGRLYVDEVFKRPA